MAGQRPAISFPGGVSLSPWQIQQLQWVLPTPFSEQLTDLLQHHAVTDAKLRFSHEGTEHWWHAFSSQRMLEELLHQPATHPFTFGTLLPLAGCGQRRTTLYLVDVRDLSLWQVDQAGPPSALGLTLQQVLHAAVYEPLARARQRLPTQARPGKSRARPTTRPAKPAARRRAQNSPSCQRTLQLFE